MKPFDWTQPTKPEDLERKPWMSAYARVHFYSLVSKDLRVVEFGSGGSTLWFLDQGALVTSYENNLKWADFMEQDKKVPVRAWDGATHLDIPQHDLLYVDGDPCELRPVFAKMAWPQLIRGGWMVLDNSNERRLGTMRADYLALSSEFVAIEHQPRPCGFCETAFFRKEKEL